MVGVLLSPLLSSQSTVQVSGGCETAEPDKPAATSCLTRFPQALLQTRLTLTMAITPDYTTRDKWLTSNGVMTAAAGSSGDKRPFTSCLYMYIFCTYETFKAAWIAAAASRRPSLKGAVLRVFLFLFHDFWNNSEEILQFGC